MLEQPGMLAVQSLIEEMIALVNSLGLRKKYDMIVGLLSMGNVANIFMKILFFVYFFLNK